MKTAIMNISHDLRTPLTAMSGYLELLKPMEKSKEVEQYISIIEERTAHMKKLTEEMFEYAVIASAQTEETVDRSWAFHCQDFCRENEWHYPCGI